MTAEPGSFASMQATLFHRCRLAVAAYRSNSTHVNQTVRRLFVPTSGPSDWRRLLADPARHWRMTKSAYEVAVAWEGVRAEPRGIPTSVATVLDSHPDFNGATLLIGIPEHQVDLIGGGRSSQTDLWALIATSAGVVSMALEAKAGEPFDRPVPDWLAAGSARSRKSDRLVQLCNVLAITRAQAEQCRYQLVHRAAVAVLEARRFSLARALFLVQSFAPDTTGLRDYQCFARQLGVDAPENMVVAAGERHGVQLWLCWVSSGPADDLVVRAAV